MKTKQNYIKLILNKEKRMKTKIIKTKQFILH